MSTNQVGEHISNMSISTTSSHVAMSTNKIDGSPIVMHHESGSLRRTMSRNNLESAQSKHFVELNRQFTELENKYKANEGEKEANSVLNLTLKRRNAMLNQQLKYGIEQIMLISKDHIGIITQERNDVWRTIKELEVEIRSMELDIAGKEIEILRIGQRNETLAKTNIALAANIETLKARIVSIKSEHERWISSLFMDPGLVSSWKVTMAKGEVFTTLSWMFPTGWNEQLHKAFDHADANKTGQLWVGELQQALQWLNTQTIGDRVARTDFTAAINLMRKGDTNADNVLSRNEFIQLMNEESIDYASTRLSRAVHLKTEVEGVLRDAGFFSTGPQWAGFLAKFTTDAGYVKARELVGALQTKLGVVPK